MATEKQKKAFIELIAPAVINTCKAKGWGVPSAIIAQACLESAWGTSGLATTCFNYWGMKWKDGCGCDYKAYQTKEQKSDGTYYTITSKFRKYKNVADGIAGYFKFIESYSRYKPVMATKNYKDFATQIKACGWATSLAYTNNIIRVVEANGLTKYDKVDTSTPAKPSTSKDTIPTFKKDNTYKTAANLYVRVTPGGDKKKLKDLTADGKKHSTTDAKGYAILNKGTVVTCKEVKKVNGSTWIKIPSGYICAYSATNDKTYIKPI